MLNAVRQSDLTKLKQLYAQGLSMSACNQFSESIVHLACRRSNLEVVEFLLTHGADLKLIDDYGRNPLHDACWRSEPHFEIVTMILDKDPSLLYMQDVRGCTPLQYVRREHWLLWCAYLYSKRNLYWCNSSTL